MEENAKRNTIEPNFIALSWYTWHGHAEFLVFVHFTRAIFSTV